MVAYSYVFILLTLASGYSFLKLTHFTKYRIIKYSGQELFFSSAVIGVGIFLLGYIICNIIELENIALFSFLSSFYTDISIMYSVTGWIFSFLFILLFNKIYKNSYSIDTFIDEQNDGIERILKISQLKARPILITLSSRKIYIGIVSQSFFSPLENKSFTILPLISGYRDVDTQELHITNKYIDYISKFFDIEGLNDMDDEDEINRFILALPIDSITSVSLFNMDIYEEFNADNIQQEESESNLGGKF